jgi:Zn-dependent peptidase ImmA (M78 family)
MIRTEPLLLTAAAEARRLLERYGISNPDEIVLEDIAWDLGIEVTFGSLSGAEAHMVRVGDVGTITVSDRLLDRGAQRFAIAHELGHWQMHQAASQVFFCTDSDMKEYRHSGQELEANTFASELLIPKAMIEPRVLSSEPSLRIISELSKRFSVAPVAAAVRYVDLAKQPIMAVFSDGKNVKWWRENRPKMDGLWLESQQPLAEDSVAFHCRSTAEVDNEMVQVPWSAWFPHCQRHEEEELFELATTVDDQGTIMSLLWAPER